MYYVFYALTRLDGTVGEHWQDSLQAFTNLRDALQYASTHEHGIVVDEYGYLMVVDGQPDPTTFVRPARLQIDPGRHIIHPGPWRAAR